MVKQTGINGIPLHLFIRWSTIVNRLPWHGAQTSIIIKWDGEAAVGFITRGLGWGKERTCKGELLIRSTCLAFMFSHSRSLGYMVFVNYLTFLLQVQEFLSTLTIELGQNISYFIMLSGYSEAKKIFRTEHPSSTYMFSKLIYCGCVPHFTICSFRKWIKFLMG